jgi:hypothetical protein
MTLGIVSRVMRNHFQQRERLSAFPTTDGFLDIRIFDETGFDAQD